MTRWRFSVGDFLVVYDGTIFWNIDNGRRLGEFEQGEVVIVINDSLIALGSSSKHVYVRVLSRFGVGMIAAANVGEQLPYELLGNLC